MIKIRPVIFLAVIFSLAVGVLTGCPQRGRQGIKDLSPERKTEIVRNVLTWLECEECEEGQLERVRKQGDVAVPTLAAALKEGPSPASLELLRMGLEERYDKLQAYATTHKDMKIDQSKDEFVDHYMGNYDSLYRIRAAEALSAIGSKQSRKALEEASKGNYRDDVNQAIKRYLKKK
jgi:hypothetical protein